MCSIAFTHYYFMKTAAEKSKALIICHLLEFGFTQISIDFSLVTSTLVPDLQKFTTPASM